MRFTEKESAEIAERVRTLITALKFYADERRYKGPNQNPIPNDPYAKPDAVYIQDVTKDHGDIARKALTAVVGQTRGGS